MRPQQSYLLRVQKFLLSAAGRFFAKSWFLFAINVPVGCFFLGGQSVHRPDRTWQIAVGASLVERGPAGMAVASASTQVAN